MQHCPSLIYILGFEEFPKYLVPQMRLQQFVNQYEMLNKTGIWHLPPGINYC